MCTAHTSGGRYPSGTRRYQQLGFCLSVAALLTQNATKRVHSL